MDIINTLTVKEGSDTDVVCKFGDVQEEEKVEIVLIEEENILPLSQVSNITIPISQKPTKKYGDIYKALIQAKSQNDQEVNKTETIEIEDPGTVEPWPKDVKFFQPHDVEQILLPDNSCCLAVQAFLKMCNLEYQIEYRANAEYMSPSGKVPFIKHGAFLVPGLDEIVKFVNERRISLTNELNGEQKADMRTYMALITNVLLNAELYICWKDSDTFNAITKNRYGYVYPWPLNWIQTNAKRAKITRWLKMISWENKTLEEVYKEVENCCIALTERLDGKKYFFEHGFTELDALTYAHLHCMLTTSLPSHLGRIVEGFEQLVQLCRHIDRVVMLRECDLGVKPWTTFPVLKSVKIRVPQVKAMHGDVVVVQQTLARKEEGEEDDCAAVSLDYSEMELGLL